jgi:ribulose-phosphate 3-epimerase
MDGVFVPNFTYGLPIVAALRQLTTLPIDAHLMMVHPEKYIKAFRDAGADLISFHFEAVDEPAAVLELIKSEGAAAGVAINPQTSVAQISDLVPQSDFVVVMSVQAGFGGQSFNPSALEKVRQLRGLANDRLFIEIDGGINVETLANAVEAGVDWAVVGSAIFAKPDYALAVSELNAVARRARPSSASSLATR